MAKQQLKQKETQVAATNGDVGKQMEQTLIVDDSCLPSPEELAAYKSIDQSIVDFLIETSKKEQEHRHKIDDAKIKILKKSESRITSINICGMLFAFLSIIVLAGLSGFALYLDKLWVSLILGVGDLVSIAAIFIKREDNKQQRR